MYLHTKAELESRNFLKTFLGQPLLYVKIARLKAWRRRLLDIDINMQNFAFSFTKDICVICYGKLPQNYKPILPKAPPCFTQGDFVIDYAHGVLNLEASQCGSL
jgi:hypothetical protein